MKIENILKELVRDGNRFRKTPIVDDDFPAIRDQFDQTLRSCEEKLSVPRPTIVCLCGSTQFMEAYQEATLRFTLEGKIILSIGCNTKSDVDLQKLGTLTAEKKIELDELHKRKIDLSDEILVLNVGGYIGESTRSEIEYALKIGVKVKYLEYQKNNPQHDKGA